MYSIVLCLPYLWRLLFSLTTLRGNVFACHYNFAVLIYRQLLLFICCNDFSVIYHSISFCCPSDQLFVCYCVLIVKLSYLA